MYDGDNAIDASSLRSHLSLTPKVLENLHPLKSFQVSHMTSRIPSYHITVPMINALRPHAESLRSLQIQSDFAVDGDVLMALLDFIASTKLRRLRLRLRIPARFEKLETHKYLPETLWPRDVMLSGDLHLNPHVPLPVDVLDFGVNDQLPFTT